MFTLKKHFHVVKVGPPRPYVKSGRGLKKGPKLNGSFLDEVVMFEVKNSKVNQLDKVPKTSCFFPGFCRKRPSLNLSIDYVK